MARSVLYLAPITETFRDLCKSMDRLGWLDVERTGDGYRWHGDGLDVDVEVVADPAAAVDRVSTRYYGMVVVDARHLPGTRAVDCEHAEAQVERFLRRLRQVRDRDLRYPLDRVTVLVGDADEERTDRLIFELGANHVGTCLRDMSLSPLLATDGVDHARERFVGRLWKHLFERITRPRSSRKALCAAGGGITGIYYELGVLKCLDDAMPGFDVRDFDMYFGISAGAIVTSLVANGFAIDEIIDSFSARSGPAFDIEIKLQHLAWRDLPDRSRATFRHLRDYVRRVLEREERLSLAGVVSNAAAMIGPLFDGEAFERHLGGILSRPGHSNDFRKLKRELYIGATDQDIREHVLFGDTRHDHVPISKAVQASTAIHPFFRSVEIDGRRYTDGFVTRTSNLPAAVHRGAGLVFVIDPFLPLISHKAGFNHMHSSFWVTIQDYKTVAYTRFHQVTEAFLRQNPQVTCYAFLPSNRMRRLMASNPIATRNFDAIVTQAYRSTYRRLRQLEHKIAPELDEHGIAVDLSRPARTIKALDALIWPRAQVLFE